MKRTLSIILALVLLFSLSLTAFATTSSNVDVNGHIGTQGDPSVDPTDPTYDIVLSTSVHWWVTQNNPGVIVDGTSSGPGTVNNLIRNNKNGTTINVTFDEFALVAGDAEDVADDLTLFLTGDLAEDDVGDEDLSNGYSSTSIPYTTQLIYGTDWTFGFTGTYSGELATTMLAPAYTMTLGFAFE